MNTYNWYTNLIRPDWAPPSYLFGPVWSVLYVLIAVSFIKVFIMFYRKQVPSKVVLPFVLNIFFNLAFTPLQFGLQNNILAGVDIILVLVTLIWAMKVIWPYSKWISLIQIPYLLWVSFATVLQITITYLNF